MIKTFFNSQENQYCSRGKDILSVFNEHQLKPNHIQQGMSLDEIADVVSDHLMLIIKEQFSNAKRDFHSTPG